MLSRSVLLSFKLEMLAKSGSMLLAVCVLFKKQLEGLYYILSADLRQ